MERTDVFKQILETEQKAKEQREDAVRHQAGLDKYLAEKEGALRRDTYSLADEELAKEEERFRLNIDKDIEKLREKQTRDVLNIHVSFDKKLDEWVDTLFDIVVGNA